MNTNPHESESPPRKAALPYSRLFASIRGWNPERRKAGIKRSDAEVSTSGLFPLLLLSQFVNPKS